MEIQLRKRNLRISNASATVSNRFTTDYTARKTETDSLSIENYISTSEQSSDENDDYVATSIPKEHKSPMSNVDLSNNDI